MTIRTIEDLDASAAAGAGVRGIDAALMQDILDSVKGVGGVMFANDQVLSITSNWAPVTVMTAVRNTRGITPDIPGGLFTVDPGADGPYALDVSFGIYSGLAGWVEVGISKNGQTPFTKKRRSLTAGGDGSFSIPDGIDLAAGDTIGVGVRGSGSADITLVDATFRVVRA